MGKDAQIIFNGIYLSIINNDFNYYQGDKMIIKRKITVDSDRLGRVQLKLDKLNKKAIKLGIEPSHIVSQVDRVV